ncbi:hypothetical protein JRI60_00520 [Archangium violaceum]|uniref:hypothetical protein n=1 Tax=Archangium violaceum TaxID=83451 RepID=UPI00194F67FD|nr:hypothetical protein [Archangium violaceum]QRN97614.1 hypothetical protein JRI60_00520 [Archangium violaceum]
MSTSETKKPEQSVLLEVPEAQKPQKQEETKGSARFNSPRPLREWQPEQGQLLPQYAREVLGEGHLACFFVELVKVLDFSPILGGVHQGMRAAALPPGDDDVAAHVRLRARHYEQPGD